MSLANRLSAVVPSPGRRDGCSTCRWLGSISDADRDAYEAWIDEGRSITQLWEVCRNDPDHPIPVGVSSMRLHIRTCRRMADGT